MQYKILAVDDETANLRLLERLFRGKYDVLTASSGAEAIDLLELHDIALIISDQRMPGMTGIDFLKQAAEMRPQTVRIMLTGYTDAEALVEAINSGLLYKYVAKPWSNEDLQQTAKRALQHYETLKGQRQLQLQNERLRSRLDSMRDSFVRITAEMLDLKDPYARSHAQRTSEYAAEIGRKMNLDHTVLDQLSLTAFLHEVVDFRIPSNMLHRDSPLSPTEQEIAKHGFDLGLQLFEDVPEFEDIVADLKFVHEQYDGGGFPMGFAYDQIPLNARIIAVADAFDSWVSPKPLQAMLSSEDAIARLEGLSGTRFDPEVVKCFCSPLSEIEPATVSPTCDFTQIYGE